jgi:hypothetical protein
MDWTSKLPERLTAAAYRAGGECAWGKKDALEVINWLSSQGEVVSPWRYGSQRNRGQRFLHRLSISGLSQRRFWFHRIRLIKIPLP